MNKANRHSPPPPPPNLWLLDNQAKVNTNPQKVFLKKQLSMEKNLYQNGLSRIPVPKGENGFTFAHIKASFNEIVDFPSSRKYTGPCTQ